MREVPLVPDHHDNLFALLPGLQPGPFDGRLARSLARDDRRSPTPSASVPRGTLRVSARSGSPGGSLKHATSAREKKHDNSSAALGSVLPTSDPVYREAFSRYYPAGGRQFGLASRREFATKAAISTCWGQTRTSLDGFPEVRTHCPSPWPRHRRSLWHAPEAIFETAVGTKIRKGRNGEGCSGSPRRRGCRRHALMSLPSPSQYEGREMIPDPVPLSTKYRYCRGFPSGRGWVRTSDLLLVREIQGIAGYCPALLIPLR